MQYVTTRNKKVSYSSQHVLKENRGPDGGLFVPKSQSCFLEEEVRSLLKKPFEQCVAQVLNRLCDTKLSGWDITFYTGRYPVRVKKLGYRTMIGELWHNPGWQFSKLVENLLPLISSKDVQAPAEWAVLVIYIAVFAGLCSELCVNGFEEPVDFAVISGDFTAPVSAWYLREWGFPIGNIICCCNENGNLWDLFSNGQMKTDGITVATETPAADVVIPVGLERLIYGCGGVKEVEIYQKACQSGRVYMPQEDILHKIQAGMYVSVVGNQRMKETIPRVYASRQYLLSPYDALCYCGLLDCRVRFGETAAAILISEKAPLCDRKTVADSLGITEDALNSYL